VTDKKIYHDSETQKDETAELNKTKFFFSTREGKASWLGFWEGLNCKGVVFFMKFLDKRRAVVSVFRNESNLFRQGDRIGGLHGAGGSSALFGRARNRVFLKPGEVRQRNEVIKRGAIGLTFGEDRKSRERGGVVNAVERGEMQLRRGGVLPFWGHNHRGVKEMSGPLNFFSSLQRIIGDKYEGQC